MGCRIGSVLLGLVLLGCGASDEDDPEPPRLVVTEPVSTGDAVDELAVLGDVHGEMEVRVFAQMAERIRILHVREGDAVRAGDPIATLEADLASSDVTQAGAALTAAEAGRDRLESEVSRIGGLVAQRAAAQSQLDTLESNLRSAQAQVAQLRAVRGAASARRSRTVVRAPLDGLIALLSVSEGDMVAPALPLCTVVQLDRLEIVVQVVEEDYVRLRDGMAAEVRPPALPDIRRAGRITRISPVLDRLTRTAQVRVLVDNADHVLRPGMVAEVTVELDRRPGVVMVPAQAVIMTPRTDTTGEANVFVAQGDTAERRTVHVGRRYGQRFEITDGLETGEQVVVEGQHLLRDGSPIREEREPEAREGP